jgi:putative ABC transport system permease protein
MLQIKNIKKQYKTGDFVQQALAGVSLNLRDNEFVAILGPSGSGKTTLLNIIGGLDRYDEGDLIINGVSTKRYKDRDWDSYRNHTIGFVFQSYNLISHQTVLSNVELALTISGISGAERRSRAEEALRQVGLYEHMHKKPNQLSGGQMQRVAIARALVNNPDIVLADEPTGALDSETSVQIMDLLKEVAKDRLVVMVTHNPELAQQYATRIVTISDGRILDDTDPFLIDEEETAPPVHKNLGKASMSFLTALSLSFNNLRTKKARTFLVAFAGSIGIIGIALILSLSHGVNKYIDDTEEETLAEYPLQIEKASFDLSALMTDTNLFDDSNVQTASSDASGLIGVQEAASSLLSDMNTNDLKSLKAFFDSGDSGIEPFVNAIEYKYDITPQIYRLTDASGNAVNSASDLSSAEKDASGDADYVQVNPNNVFSSVDMGSSQFSTMMTTAMNSDVFTMLPSNSSLYEDQYNVVAGHWPKNSHELVLVLSENGNISDALLYAIGMRSTDDLQSSLDEESGDASDEKDSQESSDATFYKYDDFLGMSFKLVNSCDYYRYDSDNKVWVNKSDNKKFVKELVNDADDITIVGIVQPKENATSTMLSSGICYPASMITDLVKEASHSKVVSDQLADPDTNVLTGNSFDDDNNADDFDLNSLFNINEDALEDIFSVDSSALSGDNVDFSSLGDSFSNIDFSNMNLGDLMDADSLSSLLPSMSEEEIQSLLDGVVLDTSTDTMTDLFQTLLEGYLKYAENDGNSANDYDKLADSLKAYLQDAFSSGKLPLSYDSEQLKSGLTSLFQGYLSYCTSNGLDPSSSDSFTAYLDSDEGKSAAASLFSAFTLDSDALDSLVEGYKEYAKENAVPDPSAIAQDFANYLKNDKDAQAAILAATSSMIDTDQLEKNLSAAMTSAIGSVSENMSSQISTALSAVMGQVGTQLEYSMANAMTSMMSNLGNMFSFDSGALANIFETNMTSEDIQELLTSLMSGSSGASYEDNLSNFGYADLDDPNEIDIYPKNFDAKNSIVSILDQYNDDVSKAGEDDKVISYTDMVATMMSSITNIINAISSILVAFVGISLVVSSIMIGVITYISVLERRKEIGILRAIGASKRNVGQVFNAETFITGLLAGILGIVISELLIIPINIIIPMVAPDTAVRAALPIPAAFGLIVLSVILTLIAGLLPARKASKSDPVTALRTD